MNPDSNPNQNQTQPGRKNLVSEREAGAFCERINLVGDHYRGASIHDALQAFVDRRLVSSPIPITESGATQEELAQIEELRFYKENGFPFVDHSNGSKGFKKIRAAWEGLPFDDSDCGYWAITLPAHLPNPAGEGTVAGTIIHAYTIDQLYLKALAHMAAVAATGTGHAVTPQRDLFEDGKRSTFETIATDWGLNIQRDDIHNDNRYLSNTTTHFWNWYRTTR